LSDQDKISWGKWEGWGGQKSIFLLGIELGRWFSGKKIGSQNCFQLPVFIVVGGNGFEPSTSGM
jgi:hypothetical protein